MRFRNTILGVLFWVVCIALPSISNSAGLTIVTHGYTEGSLPPWVDAMGI